MLKYFEKDGVCFEVNSVLEEARLKRIGFKEVAEIQEAPAPEIRPGFNQPDAAKKPAEKKPAKKEVAS